MQTFEGTTPPLFLYSELLVSQLKAQISFDKKIVSLAV